MFVLYNHVGNAIHCPATSFRYSADRQLVMVTSKVAMQQQRRLQTRERDVNNA